MSVVSCVTQQASLGYFIWWTYDNNYFHITCKHKQILWFSEWTVLDYVKIVNSGASEICVCENCHLGWSTKVIVTFKSGDENLKRDHLHESYTKRYLFGAQLIFAVQHDWRHMS